MFTLVSENARFIPKLWDLRRNRFYIVINYLLLYRNKLMTKFNHYRRLMPNEQIVHLSWHYNDNNIVNIMPILL